MRTNVSIGAIMDHATRSGSSAWRGYQQGAKPFLFGFHTKIPHFFEIWPNIPIYLMFAVQISIPYQYTSFWGSGIPIYLMFSENSSNIPIYRMHDLGAQKGHTNIPHVFEKWPNIPIYLNLTSTRKLLQAHCYIGIYPT